VHFAGNILSFASSSTRPSTISCAGDCGAAAAAAGAVSRRGGVGRGISFGAISDKSCLGSTFLTGRGLSSSQSGLDGFDDLAASMSGNSILVRYGVGTMPLALPISATTQPSSSNGCVTRTTWPGRSESSSLSIASYSHAAGTSRGKNAATCSSVKTNPASPPGEGRGLTACSASDFSAFLSASSSASNLPPCPASCSILRKVTRTAPDEAVITSKLRCEEMLDGADQRYGDDAVSHNDRAELGRRN
jgi:hypothetical protein